MTRERRGSPSGHLGLEREAHGGRGPDHVPAVDQEGEAGVELGGAGPTRRCGTVGGEQVDVAARRSAPPRR